MKQLTKRLTRIWFTLSCILTFGLGWIALSRSDAQKVDVPQTTNNVQTAGSFDLGPVYSVQDFSTNSSTTSSSSTSSPQFRVSVPVLRTRGS